MPKSKQALPADFFKLPRIRPWSVIVLIVSVVGIYLLLPQLKQLRGIGPVLHHAVWWWICAGMVTTALGFLSSAYTQYVAGRNKGVFSTVALLQLTGAFINHFLPFNLGSVSLTARYYRDIGESQPQAFAFSILPTIFGVSTTVFLLAIISPVTLRHIFTRTYHGNWNLWYIAIAAALVIGILIALPRVRKRIHTFIREVILAVTGIRLWPQLPALIAGNFALTVVSTITLIFSALAVHTSIGIFDAFTLYVTSSLISNFAPTPGGIGAMEAFLTLGLTSVGMSLPEAAAVTLIFRLVSFWIPIIPGILALRQVNRLR